MSAILFFSWEKAEAIDEFESAARFANMANTVDQSDGLTPAERHMREMLVEVEPIATASRLSAAEIAEAVGAGRWSAETVLEAASLIRSWAKGAAPAATFSAMLDRLREPWHFRH